MYFLDPLDNCSHIKLGTNVSSISGTCVRHPFMHPFTLSTNIYNALCKVLRVRQVRPLPRPPGACLLVCVRGQ